MKESTKEFIGINKEEMFIVIGCLFVFSTIHFKLDFIYGNLLSIIAIIITSLAIHIKHNKKKVAWKELNLVIYSIALVVQIIGILYFNFVM